MICIDYHASFSLYLPCLQRRIYDESSTAFLREVPQWVRPHCAQGGAPPGGVRERAGVQGQVAPLQDRHPLHHRGGGAGAGEGGGEGEPGGQEEEEGDAVRFGEGDEALQASAQLREDPHQRVPELRAQRGDQLRTQGGAPAGRRDQAHQGREEEGSPAEGGQEAGQEGEDPAHQLQGQDPPPPLLLMQRLFNYHIENIINLLSMIAIGPSLRRKSFMKADPVLPKLTNTTNRQPSTKGRTVYKQLKMPAEELKDFKKRQLITLGNLSTEKSTSRINPDDLYIMKQSRYDEDHHNTDSIAQLFEHKNDSQLPSSIKTKRESLQKSEVAAQSISDPKLSLQSESIVDHSEERPEERVEQEGEGKEGENYDDYVLGEKVEEQSQEERGGKGVRKYAYDHSLKVINRYKCESQGEWRMEREILLSERRRLAQVKEDREIAALMASYKNNKQQMLAQAARKHETARILASLHHNNHAVPNKIEKSTSLPLLKPKKEILLPEDNTHNTSNTSRNLLAKSFEKHAQPDQTSKLKHTLSYGKLGFGRKKSRTICEAQILEEEMTSLQEIKQKLRSKGIRFDANGMKKGLVNFKHEEVGLSHPQYPQKALPSNPIYKKFPL